MIKNPKKRQLLVAMLGIPATLMGLEHEQQTTVAYPTFNNDRMAFYEQTMARH